MSTISVSHLTKDYGKNRGVFDLSFTVAQGEAFGFLGPNGAGKTTTIRHLLGFLNADAGECAVGGLNARRDAAQIQRNLGYLPGEIAFFDDMTGTQYLHFAARLRGLTDLTKMKALLAEFELDPSGRIKKMSKGMKQKLGIVTAFMHDPAALILDEPTSGLDPLMQSRFIDLILREKRAGKTILMSSHSFEEVERTCDRIGIIRRGRFAAVSTVEELQKARRRIYAVTLKTAEEAQAFAQEGLEVISQDGCTVRVAMTHDLKPLTAALDRHGVTGIDVVRQSLEEIFLSYYGGEAHA